MVSNRFIEPLSCREFLLADGATGTDLFAAGLPPGESPERWNLEHPDKIATLHRGFIDAGSDLILTNSFVAHGSARSCTSSKIRWRRSTTPRRRSLPAPPPPNDR